MKKLIPSILMAILFVACVSGQGDLRGEGVTWGPVRVAARGNALVAYDSRIIEKGTTTEGGSYSEIEAGVSLRNLPARYNASADAMYGYRFHSEYSEIDDDFYRLSTAIKSADNPVQLGLSADYDKSLNYRTDYNFSTGQDPDLVLINEPNVRLILKGNLGYSRMLTDKLSIKPEYVIQHYDQQLTDTSQTDVAEWQTHNASLAMRYHYSANTLFSLGGVYSLQVRDDENGKISTVYLGSESKLTAKTSWNIKVGVSAVDYERSGTDVTAISDFRFMWKASDKVSAYTIAGNRHLPGYGDGAARMVYRAGYGLDWDIMDRLSLGTSGLHNYEDALGNDSAPADYEESKHFHAASLNYLVGNNLAVKLGIGYTQDEQAEDRLVATFEIGYSR